MKLSLIPFSENKQIKYLWHITLNKVGVGYVKENNMAGHVQKGATPTWVPPTKCERPITQPGESEEVV